MSVTRKKLDPVKVWFFIVLVALIPAVAILVWVVTDDIHL